MFGIMMDALGSCFFLPLLFLSAFETSFFTIAKFPKLENPGDFAQFHFIQLGNYQPP